ncbi:MAG: phosphate uptake regulator PhoU [Saccharolobus sp.]|uniref:Phosphate regulatory protein, putative n=2 Tax=Saccharolobus shibatae TaxID=2286 RepID=A0A8F5BXQ3_9CREN|nr:phosphate uptake regulator PhoU [Saccharolobus shibatae]MCH4814536.1 phosphate uptake regulator PhoU [Saccharolobus shibatae]QXJ30189.1 Phosphate regulatory protein, putative [Saccharolobus shibatae B12]QXJ33378.1 Phosphate regulatory protein, putative [Saccharolobus shibatae]QXJ36492.1 Phosphate regulatory protein, putative [Saccharolobus shibatae]
MEVRRVQKFGKSTLMVSLPAEWVKEVSLSPGESVYLEVDEDGSLKVYPPNLKAESKAKEMKISIQNDSVQGELVSRVIYSLYILGYDRIDIESKSGIFTEDILRKVKDTIRNLIGLEIVSQTTDTIQIQSFLDPTKYTMNNLINRLSNSIKQMLHYLDLGIKESSRTFLQEVIELEREVDRLYYLALRQLLLAQMNRSLAYMIGVKRIQIVGNRILIKAIEEAADEISEIALDLLSLHPSDLEEMKRLWNKINMYIEQTSSVIDHAVKVLAKEDTILINEVMEELRTLRRVLITEAIISEEMLKEVKSPSLIAVLRALNLRLYNAIRRMEPITEIAFNRSIENQKEILITG